MSLLLEFLKKIQSPTSLSYIRLLAVKVGIASAAVYYINEQGVWKQSNESVRTYEKLKEVLNPYVSSIKTQIPFKLPAIPESDKLSTLVKQSWNVGVLTTFQFIINLPETVNEWSVKGYDSAMQNPDIKNFIDSFSNPGKVEKK